MKRIGFKFGHDGRAVSFFPVFVIPLRRPPFWAAFFLHLVD
ncbi:MAG: hypothetical protein ACLS7Z_10525 [Christensenellales bacterium]